MKNIIIPILAVLFLTSCNEVKEEKIVEKSFDLAPVKAAIEASNKTYGDAFVKGDSALMIAKYTKDGCIMPEGAPKMCGAEGLAAFFAVGHKQMGIKNVKLTTEEVMGSGDVVVETGTYDLIGAGDKSMDKGKYVVAWKQEDGKWKMHRDMFNSSVAPAAPKK